MNDLAVFAHTAKVPAHDQEQFAMLIGYSLSGFLELSYVRDKTKDRVVEYAGELGLIDPKKHFWWQQSPSEDNAEGS